MPKEKLTDTRIRNIKTDERIEVYDTETKGLGLRVTPNGHKSFFYRYRFGGTVKRYTIGTYAPPVLTLAYARKEAMKLRVQASGGDDPQGEKLKVKHEDAPKKVGELAKVFIEQHVRKNIKPSAQQNYINRLNKIVGWFKNHPIESLSRADVKRYLKQVAEKHPYDANRLQAHFSKMFSFAVDEEITINHPLRRLEKFGKEIQRDRFYTTDEIRKLWEAFKMQPEPLQSLLKVLFMTGQRVGETSRMRWSDVDLEKGVWTIPAIETKAGRIHAVPLTEGVIKLLENIYQLTGRFEYVFTSPINSAKPLNHFARATKRIRELSGIEDFRTHDLRRTVMTYLAEVGVDRTVLGKLLNHRGLSGDYHVTSVYDRYDYMDEKRTALNRWGFQLEHILTGTRAKIYKIGG